MSVLRPKTAKPRLVRHESRTRDRHEISAVWKSPMFGICVDTDSAREWSRPRTACVRGVIVDPAPARVQVRCPPLHAVDSRRLVGRRCRTCPPAPRELCLRPDALLRRLPGTKRYVSDFPNALQASLPRMARERILDRLHIRSIHRWIRRPRSVALVA